MENLKIVQLLKDKEVKKIIRKLHIDIYRTFNKVLLIFKKYNIRYTLAHGTLLGQVRNNNLLLWDDDIDFVIENDKIFENKDFLKDCYDIGLAVIITPYELGYSALYRMTDHKYLNEQPNIKPSLGGPNYNYPKLIVDVHDVSHYRKKPFNIDFINFDNVELCNMGPLNVVKIKNYMPLIKNLLILIMLMRLLLHIYITMDWLVTFY